jgi:hypothetical protein
LRAAKPTVYRQPVAAWMMTRRAGCAGVLAAALASLSDCTSVDPGPNFVVPNATFDPDYYYCHVEPQFIVYYKCGPGDASDNSSCHFSSAVSGMALIDHPAINCGGGDHPVDLTQITQVAQGDYQAVSLEMSSDYVSAPVFVRPSGNSHPRAIFQTNDKVANQILSTWASK